MNQEMYILKPFAGRMAVLKVLEESRSEYCLPDFMGTGYCLDGILRSGETLEDFIHRKQCIKERIEKNNEKLPQSLIKKKVFAVPKEKLYEEICRDPYLSRATSDVKRKFTDAILRILSKIERENR